MHGRFKERVYFQFRVDTVPNTINGKIRGVERDRNITLLKSLQTAAHRLEEGRSNHEEQTMN